MGGDIYKYVQEVNNLEFQDAVELVAEKYGFKLTYTETSQTNDFKNFQHKINLIDEYFKEMMDSEKSEQAKDYLNFRMLGFNICSYTSQETPAPNRYEYSINFKVCLL